MGDEAGGLSEAMLGARALGVGFFLGLVASSLATFPLSGGFLPCESALSAIGVLATSCGLLNFVGTGPIQRLGLGCVGTLVGVLGSWATFVLVRGLDYKAWFLFVLPAALAMSAVVAAIGLSRWRSAGDISLGRVAGVVSGVWALAALAFALVDRTSQTDSPQFVRQQILVLSAAMPLAAGVLALTRAIARRLS